MTSPSGQLFRELGPGLAAHRLLDSTEAFDQYANVIRLVHVLPDVLDELRDGKRVFVRLFDFEVRNVLEIAEERAVEAIEDDELRLVDVVASACAAPSICSQRMRDFTGRRKTMNSSAGMSTPVESMSTVTTIFGLGRLRNSRIRWSGRSTLALPVIFCTKSSPWLKTSRQVFTS